MSTELKPVSQTMTPEQIETLYAEIDVWNKVTKELADLVQREKELRQQFADKYFATASEGTNKLPVGHGFELQLDMRINRKVNESALDMAIQGKLLTAEEVDAVIKYKPEVSVGAYKKLPKEARDKFGDIITETPGTPGLKLHKPVR